AVFLVPSILLGAVLAGPPRRARLRLAALAAGTWLLVYAPWPLRNQIVFGQPHFFGGTVGIDKYGKPLDRGAAFEWMRTWSAGGENDTVWVAWRFPSQPLTLKDIPPEAFDSPAEQGAMAAILDEYNRRGSRLDPDLSDRLYA